jgi:chaperonin GroES
MTNLRVRPLRRQLLVEPVRAPAHVGRLVLPESAREERPQEAVVLGVGPRNELPVKVGDRVIINRFNGQEVVSGTGRYRLMEPEDVLALVGEAGDVEA